MYIITEYINGGSLEAYNLNEKFKKLESKDKENYCIFIFKNVVKAYSELHKLNLIHRDLKEANIMCHIDEISGEQSFRIIDVGTSKELV
jgi:serine/threonine protein kinase